MATIEIRRVGGVNGVRFSFSGPEGGEGNQSLWFRPEPGDLPALPARFPFLTAGGQL